MFSRLSFRAKLIILVVIGLAALVLVLQVIWTIQQQSALVEANRERSFTLIGAVNTTIDAVRPLINSIEDISELDARLANLVEQNENIDFIAVTWSDGEVIYHSDTRYQGQSLNELADLPTDDTLRKDVAGFDAVYLTTRRADSSEYSGPDEFQVVVGTAAEPIDRELRNSIFSSVIITVLAVVVLGAGIIVMLQYNLVRPIAQLSEVAEAVQAGNLSLRVNSPRQDEIGQLAKSFDSMTEQLNTLIDSLEERVAARTRDLQVASDVSRQITTELDIDKLLQQVVTLTAHRFDFYATLVFLLDEEDKVLYRAATSNVEGRVLSNDSSAKIPLDAKPSVIALAARSHEPVVVNDVQASPDYMLLSEMPNTRSEIAIPMLLGDRLLGVFDVQSDKVDRFGQDDTIVLTTLAEQIAIAVRNAQLYSEAHAAREVAEEANQVKSQFLANMSHELRTPLNAILNFTTLMAQGVLGPVNEEQVEVLNQTTDSGKHLLALINDVLDLTKIEVGMMELFIQDVDINAALDAMISTVKGLAKNKPIEIITDGIERDLPPIKGDRRRVRQILLNLASNAVKFTEAGHIKICAKHADDHIRITVEDTGIGIAPADEELVFENFRQAKHDLPETAGTGLGLPIARHFAEAHRGKLWFESEVGVGTAFHVTLPVEES